MKNSLLKTGNLKRFTDQLGNTVHLDAPPRRIISLVPSQTELLFDLGLDEEVVGLTKFCVHPKEKWRTLPRVGGTKKVDFEKIAALHPDLIIGNKEENDRSQIEELQRHYPVWMSDIVTVEDAFSMIKSVGEITGKATKAQELAEEIRIALQSSVVNHQSSIPTAYLIWYRPWMAVGSGTFIDSMLAQAGFTNVFHQKTRYPEITLEELAAAAPQVVMLSSEPFPFKEQHIAEIKQLCPSTVVKLVDGELFSWYGSRMLQAAPYFASLRKEVLTALKYLKL
ncbi:MAG: ABC transporter substrate-binding protein [Saprospiraceae bacterium]|nr:ABC transporter substrate-binding protein [Saprospiraceae bacterium]